MKKKNFIRFSENLSSRKSALREAVHAYSRDELGCGVYEINRRDVAQPASHTTKSAKMNHAEINFKLIDLQPQKNK